jgi:hypothetical protein
MRFRLHLLALLFLPIAAAAQASDKAPSCTAAMEGDRLVTTFAYPNGYTIQGPWRVLRNGITTVSGNQRGYSMTASIDRIVEFDPVTRQQQSTPFPAPVEVVFEGENEEAVMESAARIWCATVMRARGNAPEPASLTRTIGRVTAIAVRSENG